MDELEAAVAELERSDVIGIDTEADSFFSYREQVCLVQITGNRGGPDYILDTLELPHLDPLHPILEDRGVVKVFHGADYDIVSMKRDFGGDICNIFDTMLTAQAVGFARFGLADLVHHYFGIKLEKKYQRHNWSRRPLLDEHLEYARLDSHFLPRLRELMITLIDERGRWGVRCIDGSQLLVKPACLTPVCLPASVPALGVHPALPHTTLPRWHD